MKKTIAYEQSSDSSEPHLEIIHHLFVLMLVVNLERSLVGNEVLWDSPMLRAINLLLVSVATIAWLGYEIFRIVEKRSQRKRASDLKNAKQTYRVFLDEVHKHLLSAYEQKLSHE